MAVVGSDPWIQGSFPCKHPGSGTASPCTAVAVPPPFAWNCSIDGAVTDLGTQCCTPWLERVSESCQKSHQEPLMDLLSRTPFCSQHESQWLCSCGGGQRAKACFILPGGPCARVMRKKLYITLHLAVLLREIKKKGWKLNQAPAV